MPLVIIAALIFTIFCYSFRELIKKGKLLIVPNIIQIFLFGVFHIQVYTLLGSHHYIFDTVGAPDLYDWGQFILAHICRAVDVLDLLEEYNIKLQNIKHNSAFSGFSIIVMHWMVDIFLLTLLYRFFRKRSEKIKQWWKEQLQDNKAVIIFCIIICCALFLITIWKQSWRPIDTFFLWPLDNIIRVFDIGDTFQIFHWRLHKCPVNILNSSFAITFRAVAGIYLGRGLQILIATLRIFRPPKTSEEWIDDVNDENELIRKNAVEALREISSPEAIPNLCKALGDRDSSIRNAAKRALSNTSYRWNKTPEAQSAIPGLIKALGDKEIDPEHLTKVLDKISPDWSKTQKAQSAVCELCDSLEDKNTDFEVRIAAVEAMAKIDPEEAIPILSKTLKDANEDSDVRIACAYTLEELHSPNAIPALGNVVGDEDESVRHAVVYALGKIALPEAIPALIRALGDEIEAIRSKAKTFLDAIDRDWRKNPATKFVIPIFSKALDDDYPETSHAAAYALRELRSPEAILALSNALKNRDSVVRGIAIDTLEKIRSPGVITTLIEALKDSDFKVRIMTVELLGKTASKAAIPALIKELGNKGICDVAAQALYNIDPNWYKTPAAKAAPSDLINHWRNTKY